MEKAADCPHAAREPVRCCEATKTEACGVWRGGRVYATDMASDALRREVETCPSIGAAGVGEALRHGTSPTWVTSNAGDAAVQESRSLGCAQLSTVLMRDNWAAWHVSACKVIRLQAMCAQAEASQFLPRNAARMQKRRLYALKSDISPPRRAVLPCPDPSALAWTSRRTACHTSTATSRF